jgi:hypothetical protein
MHQIELSAEQIAAFYHKEFVDDQVRDFTTLVKPLLPGRDVVVDVGGGCGHFAVQVSNDCNIGARVLDADEVSVKACRAAGIGAIKGDALNPPIQGDETIISFNLILHHLVASNEAMTRGLQTKALTAWLSADRRIFVNEYIYESYLGTVSGWLIYQITSSALLSLIGRAVARVVPAFKANTFGVGVRFRAHHEWILLFRQAGYQLRGVRVGKAEKVAWPLRLLLIKEIRRDSFLLGQ